MQNWSARLANLVLGRVRPTICDHVLHTLDWLRKNPRACHHLEMETYTWEVLPEKLRSVDVVEQVTKEYQWTLQALQERGLGQ